MLIIKIISFCLVALFLYLALKENKSSLSIYITLVAGILVFLALTPQLSEIINFVRDISSKASIDMTYISIVLKIVAIAYLTSFCSEVCKDAGSGSLASKVEFAGKILILSLSIPILMAVLDTILKIM